MIGKGCQGHQSSRSCNGRHDEAQQGVEHGTGKKLTERARVTPVRTAEVFQVAGSLSFADDGWGIAQANQQQVGQQATGPVPSRSGWMRSNSACSSARASGRAPANSASREALSTQSVIRA